MTIGSASPAAPQPGADFGSASPAAPQPRGAEPLSAELGDVLAYLAQRRDNAATIARKDPAFDAWAKDRQSQLDVIIGDLTAGLHIGSAAVRAALTQSNGDHDVAQG